MNFGWHCQKHLCSLTLWKVEFVCFNHFQECLPEYGNLLPCSGIGLVTPLGVGTERAWEELMAGTTGTVRLQGFHLPDGHQKAAESLPSQVVAPVDSKQLCLGALQLQVCYSPLL
jgi:hypothetical protein